MRHTLAPRKELGQHFLADDNVAKKIAAAIAPAPGDVMVEIGPGEGALTRFLAGHVRTLIAAELDERASDVLQKTFGDTIELIRDDALKLNFTELSARHNSPLRIVGNIPYQITSPLLFQLFDHTPVIRDVVFMIQREVADRIIAIPRTKAYGILTVMSKFYTIPKKLFTVAPGSFFPPPAVVSAVISLNFSDAPRHAVDEKLFRRVVRTVFAKRRKILSNGLQEIVRSADVLRSITAAFDCSRRPEELTVEDFVTLTNVAAAAGVQ